MSALSPSFYTLHERFHETLDRAEAGLQNLGRTLYTQAMVQAEKIDNLINNNIISIFAGLAYIYTAKTATMRFMCGIAIALLIKDTNRQPNLERDGFMPTNIAWLATASAIIHIAYIIMFPVSFPIFWPGAIISGYAAFDTGYRVLRYFSPAPPAPEAAPEQPPA